MDITDVIRYKSFFQKKSNGSYPNRYRMFSKLNQTLFKFECTHIHEYVNCLASFDIFRPFIQPNDIYVSPHVAWFTVSKMLTFREQLALQHARHVSA